MRITATYIFTGKITLSSSQRLQEPNFYENEPFSVTLRPGQSVEVDDKYYELKCIQDSITQGLIVVTGYYKGSFTQLSDVPHSYVGQANRLVKVKSDETGLDFHVRLTVGTVAPVNPSIGDLWVDTN